MSEELMKEFVVKKCVIGIVSMIILVSAGAANLSADAIRFAVIGDTQGSGGPAVSEENLGLIIERINAADPPVQFVLQAGDLINGGKDTDQQIKDFQRWREVVSPWYNNPNFVGLKVYPVPGNHDQKNIATYLDSWQAVFSDLPDNGPWNEKKTTYSFDIGQCHFVAVNTSAPSWTGFHAVNVAWLANNLTNSTQPVTFVYGHDPAFPVGRHIGSALDTRPERRDLFWQILSENNVKAYFCGHEHVYDHWMKDNVHQIITGSGGVPAIILNYSIVDVDDENNVTVSVYEATTNTLMDQYDLADTQNVASEDRPGAKDIFYSFLDNFPCLIYGVVLMGFGFVGFSLTSSGTWNHE
jgi:3',5'-cyclic AMP phosphodiesterase CpdA